MLTDLTREHLIEKCKELRRKLELAFSPESTRQFSPLLPSTGHCAAVALMIHHMMDADMMSTHVGGASHWFNRVKLDNESWVDVDLTGDQFGFESCRVSNINEPLYNDSRLRIMDEVLKETINRSIVLRVRVNSIGKDV